MKVYILKLELDIQSTPGGIDTFIEISKNKESLEDKMKVLDKQLNEDWNEDDEDFDGILMSTKPYYFISEYDI